MSSTDTGGQAQWHGRSSQQATSTFVPIRAIRGLKIELVDVLLREGHRRAGDHDVLFANLPLAQLPRLEALAWLSLQLPRRDPVGKLRRQVALVVGAPQGEGLHRPIL